MEGRPRRTPRRMGVIAQTSLSFLLYIFSFLLYHPLKVEGRGRTGRRLDFPVDALVSADGKTGARTGLPRAQTGRCDTTTWRTTYRVTQHPRATRAAQHRLSRASASRKRANLHLRAALLYAKLSKHFRARLTFLSPTCHMADLLPTFPTDLEDVALFGLPFTDGWRASALRAALVHARCKHCLPYRTCRSACSPLYKPLVSLSCPAWHSPGCRWHGGHEQT